MIGFDPLAEVGEPSLVAVLPAQLARASRARRAQRLCSCAAVRTARAGGSGARRRPTSTSSRRRPPSGPLDVLAADAWDWYCASPLVRVLELAGTSRALVQLPGPPGEPLRLVGWRADEAGSPAVACSRRSPDAGREPRATGSASSPGRRRPANGELRRACRLLGFVPRARPDDALGASARPALARAEAVVSTPLFTSASESRVVHAPAAVGGHPRRARTRRAGARPRQRRRDGRRAAVRVRAPTACSLRAARRLVRELRRWREVAPRGAPTSSTSTSARRSRRCSTAIPLGRPLFATYARALEQRDLARCAGAVFVTFQGDDVRPSGDRADDDARRGAPRFDRATRTGSTRSIPICSRTSAERASSSRTRASTRASGRRSASTRATARVVHAPSDRARKGTRVGWRVERLGRAASSSSSLVEGKSRAEARAALERADVVVDQLVVGWYGGVAVEAMALGKPVVALPRATDLERVPAELRAELPIVAARPDTLADVCASSRRRGVTSSPSLAAAAARSSSAGTTRSRSPPGRRGLRAGRR